MDLITQKEANKLFHYDPNTGIITRKITMGKRVKGSTVGTLNRGMYLQTGIKGKIYLVHRLVWLIVKGYFPENDLDHINRIKIDNRIENLREISTQCNRRNIGNPVNNTSGVKGVHWVESRKKWNVCIYLMNKRKYIGEFTDFHEAVCHRLAAEQCLNWAQCEDNSPAYQYIKGTIPITNYIHGDLNE